MPTCLTLSGKQCQQHPFRAITSHFLMAIAPRLPPISSWLSHLIPRPFPNGYRPLFAAHFLVALATHLPPISSPLSHLTSRPFPDCYRISFPPHFIHRDPLPRLLSPAFSDCPSRYSSWELRGFQTMFLPDHPIPSVMRETHEMGQPKMGKR